MAKRGGDPGDDKWWMERTRTGRKLYMAMYRIPCLQQSSFYCIKKFSPDPDPIPACDCIIPAMD